MTKEEFKQELKPAITTQGQIKTIKKAVGGLLEAAGKTLNYMAVWVSESEYKINDLVTYDGDMYICIEDVNDSSVTPAADSEHFAPFGEQKHLYSYLVWVSLPNDSYATILLLSKTLYNRTLTIQDIKDILDTQTSESYPSALAIGSLNNGLINGLRLSDGVLYLYSSNDEDYCDENDFVINESIRVNIF